VRHANARTSSSERPASLKYVLHVNPFFPKVRRHFGTVTFIDKELGLFCCPPVRFGVRS
jgi:hypothetical protein